MTEEPTDPTSRPPGDPWAGLDMDAALARVRKSLHPGWYAWATEIRTSHDAPTRSYIWAARRGHDGLLVHADHPGTLLTVVAEADARAAVPAPRHVLGEL